MEIAVAVIRLANSLKVTALAEGVETAAQADFLAASGCALAQGYLFDKPLWENDLIGRFGQSQRPRRTAV
jgi:EAL domain-containing protein (putative c-di-GMP-specific phosphodiesterase class I)